MAIDPDGRTDLPGLHAAGDASKAACTAPIAWPATPYPQTEAVDTVLAP